MSRAVSFGAVCGSLLVVALAFGTDKGAPTNRPPAKPGWPQRVPTNAEERVALEQQLDQAWTALPVPAKLSFMRSTSALRLMPDDERRFIEERINRFLNMGAEERERLKKNQRRWDKMSPDERQQAREAFAKRQKEFEAYWHKEQQRMLGNPPPAPGSLTNKETSATTTGDPRDNRAGQTGGDAPKQ